jgi:hypothetical protein
MALNDLKASVNVGQAAQASGLEKVAQAPGSAGYRASQKNNYAQQVRVVNGRAFYQNGNIWTDSTAQDKHMLKQKTVAFGSRDYFDLLSLTPALFSWLALGNELDVVVGDTLYSIRD